MEVEEAEAEAAERREARRRERECSPSEEGALDSGEFCGHFCGTECAGAGPAAAAMLRRARASWLQATAFERMPGAAARLRPLMQLLASLPPGLQMRRCQMTTAARMGGDTRCAAVPAAPAATLHWSGCPAL